MYGRCRAVCFTPLNEDYGFVTAESFASRKPVVSCTDSGGPAWLTFAIAIVWGAAMLTLLITRELGIKILPSNPADYIARFASALKLNAETQSKSVESHFISDSPSPKMQYVLSIRESEIETEPPKSDPIHIKVEYSDST